jgi:hypothetical protein
LNGGPDIVDDNYWSAVNGYHGISEADAIVVHSTTEDPGWIKIAVSDLQDGAKYQVNVQFLTKPDELNLYYGVRVNVPIDVYWKELHQFVVEHTIVGEYTIGGEIWEERSVYIGDAMAKNGEIILYFWDRGGTIQFYEGNVTGVNLTSTLYVPKTPLFKDGFESGDTSAWALGYKTVEK